MTFPTLKQTLRAWDDAKISQSQASLDCLFAVLRASYDDGQPAAWGRGLAPNGTHFDGASVVLLDFAGFFRFRKCEDLERRG